MTAQVTFGDMLDAAREHLDRAGAVPGRPGVGRDLPDVTRAMHALVVVIGRYLQDDAGGHGYLPQEPGRSPAPWTAARAQALVAGGDLLATHLTSEADGVRAGRSMWAPVVCSPAVSRAVAAEMGALARQAAALGAGLVMVTSAGWEETSQPRRDLTAACQYLRMLHGAVRAAHEQEPVLAGEREPLRAIPIGVAPPRRLPDGSEPVPALCQGVIRAADRLRHSAGLAGGRAGWSPYVSAASLRHAAAASVAASHHCSVLLAALARRSAAAEGGEARTGLDLAAAMTGAAEAAGQARDGWLRITRTLDQITSDMPGHISADAADARDLALWTGRLAYADPQWMLASGPKAAERIAAGLAPGPDDAAAVVAAVHQASDSVLQLAEAHERLARSAAQAGRFLVPTHSLPDYYDIPRPYGPAPPDRVGVVLSAYGQGRQANAEAQARAADVAASTRSPSTALTLARAMTSGSVPDRQQAGRSLREKPAADVATYQRPDVPGPVERSLQMLGITDPDRVRHAKAIDRAGEQLIVDASTERASRPAQPAQRGTPMHGANSYGFASGLQAMGAERANLAPLQREQPQRQAE